MFILLVCIHMWPAMRKGTIWDKNSISSSSHGSVKSKFLQFSVYQSIWIFKFSAIFWYVKSKHLCHVSCSYIWGIICSTDVYFIIQFNGYFPEIETINPVPKIDHNSACGHSFLLKLSTLYSTQIGLSVHSKNSRMMKNPKWSLFI